MVCLSHSFTFSLPILLYFKWAIIDSVELGHVFEFRLTISLLSGIFRWFTCNTIDRYRMSPISLFFYLFSFSVFTSAKNFYYPHFICLLLYTSSKISFDSFCTPYLLLLLRFSLSSLRHRLYFSCIHNDSVEHLCDVCLKTLVQEL